MDDNTDDDYDGIVARARTMGNVPRDIVFQWKIENVLFSFYILLYFFSTSFLFISFDFFSSAFAWNFKRNRRHHLIILKKKGKLAES